MGDIDGNETISVGNIENATGIAIGPGATSTVYQGLSIEEVAALVAELKRVDQPAVWDGRVPYLGLNPFHESDAQFFFGREELVDDLLQRVQEARFIAIAGPSGSGKSSVARAGLFHALRQGDLERSDTWLLASMHPKDEPIRQLTLAMSRLTGSPSAGEYIMQQGKSNPLAMHKQAEALLSDAQRQRFILLVDQFEEIFTQTKDEEARTAFLDMLTTAVQLAEGRVTVIICMRSDFISHCANYPQLGRLISRQFQLVSAMGPRELAKAITLPALVVGAQIEAALAKQIIDDMKGEPGALPLMSFALRDLFESEKTQKGRPLNLTRQEYLQRGGIDSALQRHADAVFEAFTEEQQALAKTIFSRLIVAGEGRADTRRTAEIAELVPGGASATAVASVIARLAEEEARLVTTGGVDSEEELIRGLAGARATVTIAHEKLIDAWPWLRRLVDENRETIVLQNQISAEARIWNETEPKDDGYLYRGGRLLRVEEQYEKLRPGLDQRSLQFVEASLALRQGEIDADKARQQEKLDHVRALAEEQRRRAEEAEAAAERLRKLTQLAEARELAFRSSVTLKRDRNQGLLLAYRAMQKTYRTEKRITGEAHAVLQAALTIRGRSLAVLTGHVRGVNSAFFSVDGERIVTASLDKTARLWDREGQGLAVLEGHTAAVMSAVFSANRERIVTVSYDKTARLWDGEGQELAVLEGHEDAVRSAVFSADGERILTASDDKTARLWDRQGRALAVLEAHTDAVRSAVFSADGLRILTASLDKSARLWDRNGSPLSVLEGHTDAVWSAVFSADGARILTASKDKTARLWDRDGAPLAVLAGHTDAVRSAVFNANGDRILTASAATLRLWNEAGQELVAMDGHTGGILSALFSADGERILTASWDKTVRLWDNQGQPLASLEGHADYVTSAVFSADGERILTASEDKTARLWDGEGQPLAVLTGHTDEVSAAIFSADGERMVTASHDNTARLWNEEGQPLAVLEGHTGGILSAVFSMDGERIVTACEDKMARLWNRDGQLLAVLRGHTAWVWSALFSADRKHIVTASEDKTARLWDGEGQVLAVLAGHTGPVRSCAFSADGERILTASKDRTARLWDGEGQEMAMLEGHTDGVVSAVFSPDGERILTASDDMTARLWDREGRPRVVLDGHTKWVVSAVFSPDGERILTASGDKTARLWDGEGQLLAMLEGHTAPVWSAVFSADRERILTASWDHTARLWDGKGQSLAVLEGHTAPVFSAVFSANGVRIVTASRDKTARIWRIYPNVQSMLIEAECSLQTLVSAEEFAALVED